MKDIFTDMQAKIGCLYVSDLPYHKRVVWHEMKRLVLRQEKVPVKLKYFI